MFGMGPIEILIVGTVVVGIVVLVLSMSKRPNDA